MSTPVSGADWRALLVRGLDQLSPPEVEHTLLELPAERQEYVGLLTDVAGWPDRSPLGRRVPGDDEVDALNSMAGRWRAVTLLDDEPALCMAATLFRRTFVLDPLYDAGDLLYAAWHDPTINAEHARRLAEEGALLVRAAPLLRDGTAVLGPDHLPGSWDPRPGWRRPRHDAEPPARRAWALRTGLVLLHWADRLDALACVTRPDVVEMLPIALGARARHRRVALPQSTPLMDAHQRRTLAMPNLAPVWAAARRVTRRRVLRRLDEMSTALEQIGCVVALDAPASSWRLTIGETELPDPALLLRRVLNGHDPNRTPALPRTPLRRRPLCLLTSSRGCAESFA